MLLGEASCFKGELLLRKKKKLLKLGWLIQNLMSGYSCLEKTVQSERDKEHLISALAASRLTNTYLQPHNRSHPTAFAIWALTGGTREC